MYELVRPGPQRIAQMRAANNCSTLAKGHRERYQCFRDAVRHAIVNVHLQCPVSGREPAGEIRNHSLGPLRVVRSTTSLPMRGLRTDRNICRARDDGLWVCFSLAGNVQLEQDGHVATLGTWDLALLDSSRPCLVDLAADVDSLWIYAPRVLLESRLLGANRIAARRISGDSAVGYVTGQMLTALTERLTVISSDEALVLSTGLLEMLSAALSEARLGTRVSRSTHRCALLGRIEAFISANFGDEALSPDPIARAVGISVRYMNRLFAEQGTTPARWMWSLRLERSRAMLEDQGQLTRPINNIAYACGFRNVSHFNRSFKLRFGVSPGLWRRRHLATAGGSS